MVRCASLLAALACLAALAGCEGKYEAKVDGVWIPQAKSSVAAPEGVTVAVRAPGEAPALPAAAVVRFAIARDVPWQEVEALVASAEAAGKSPALLVGRGNDVRAFRIDDELESEEAIEVFTTTEGKACIGPPGTREYKCVQRTDRKHIDRAFVRELVREAVKAYEIQDVEIKLAPELHWADVVRVIDGARTCCYETEVRVRVDA